MGDVARGHEALRANLRRVDQYCADLRGSFEVRDVSDKSLRISARNTLALEQLTRP